MCIVTCNGIKVIAFSHHIQLGAIANQVVTFTVPVIDVFKFMKNKLILLYRLYKVNRLSYHGIFSSIYLTLCGKTDDFGQYLWDAMNEYIELDLESDWWDLMKATK